MRKIQRLARPRPDAELIRPRCSKLRPAQTLRLLRRERVRNRAVVPNQPPPRFLVPRPRPPRQIAQAARPIDHHFAHVMLRRADQSIEPRLRLRPLRQPFSAGASFPSVPPTLKQPRRPHTFRRQLRRVRDLAPARDERPLARRRRFFGARKRMQRRGWDLVGQMMRLAPALFRRAFADRIDTHAVTLGNSGGRIAGEIIPLGQRPDFRAVMRASGDGAFGFVVAFGTHTEILPPPRPGRIERNLSP